MLEFKIMQELKPNTEILEIIKSYTYITKNDNVKHLLKTNLQFVEPIEYLITYPTILKILEYKVNGIRRILKDSGHLIFRLNSINDVNHGAGDGIEIEHHLYTTPDNRLKRFFDKDDLLYFFKDFQIEYLNEEVMTRYKLEKNYIEVV